MILADGFDVDPNDGARQGPAQRDASRRRSPRGMTGTPRRRCRSSWCSTSHSWPRSSRSSASAGRGRSRRRC